MISICIPTYNTDCSALLKSLHAQLDGLSDNAEVILLDDGCHEFADLNKKNAKLYGVIYFKNKKNLGRIKSRMKLASSSRNTWLLFLDADMIPVADNFIAKYCKNIAKDKHEVYVGGHCYKKNNSLLSLRQNYGNAREDVDYRLRNKNPYNHVFFGNIVIKKKLFNTIFSTHLDCPYGEDIYLSGMLHKLQVAVLHLNNKTFHLGIENNATFILKIEEAANTVAQLFRDNNIDKSQSKLVNYYHFLTHYKLTSITYFALAVIHPILKKSLLWFANPLFFVDLFRLYHFMKHFRNGN